jgi:hypothetical protein
MRSTKAQRENSMIRGSALQQAPAPHVRHAEIGGLSIDNQDGHRCALLTTKSRNTWTRATVFNSSG